MGGSRLPLHGRLHLAGGSDPIPPAEKHLVGTTDEPPFLNSWDDSPEVDAEPVAFWLDIGGSLQIVGSPTGGANGSIVFTLPELYWPEFVEVFVAGTPGGGLVELTAYTDGNVTCTIIDTSGGGISIPGPQGSTGPTGPSGGPPGATGATGASGSPGGATGATGPQGTPGGVGATGSPGGATGPPGPGGATGSTGPPGGPTGSTGRTGATGASGAPGGAITIEYGFDTATADADPGTGFLRLSNATQNIAGTIRVSDHDIYNREWTDVLASLGSGNLRLAKKADLGHWIVFSIGPPVDEGDYFNIPVSVVGSSHINPFLNGDSLILTYTGDTVGATGPAGIVGATGATGSGGPAGATGAGATGATGAPGAGGTPGTQGATGATGTAGAAGGQGATGPQGPQGNTGPVGGTGATGSTGPAGADANRHVTVCWFGTVPTVAGTTSQAFVIPQVNGADVVFTITRIVLRLETAGTTTTTVLVERSPGTGVFTPTTIKSMSLASGVHEDDETAAFGGGGTLTSGQLVRINWSAIGSGAATFLVQMEGHV